MQPKALHRQTQKQIRRTLQWIISNPYSAEKQAYPDLEEIRANLLEHRGLLAEADINAFLHPSDPAAFSTSDVGIDVFALQLTIDRIALAIQRKESIIVYADYDADGITAGTIMWETLHTLGANVMPYIPHRVEEGYGLSKKGIDAIVQQYKPSLIVTVDHGITAAEKVEYAKSLGIDVIVTDHHTKGETIPDCIVVHTTQLCGAGVSWFVSKELFLACKKENSNEKEHIALAAIGTIADLVPLIGPNRSIATYGLAAINKTKRIGLLALIQESGLTPGELALYNISHGIAPRLNASGRIEHAMDALRLLCTHKDDKAMILARKIALINKDRQQLTIDSAAHAIEKIRSEEKESGIKKLLFIADTTYNQGVIGLIAGKLVEEFYRPSVVLAKGETISKASARSVAGFNIVEAIRKQSDVLIDVGGHPMAAGFTIETKNLNVLQHRLEELAQLELTDAQLVKTLRIEEEILLSQVNTELWAMLQEFQPFGFGNYEPVFVSRNVIIESVRLIGKEQNHLKLNLKSAPHDAPVSVSAVAFNLGGLYSQLQSGNPIDIAYTIDSNTWNGKTTLQLKIRDIQVRLIE